jgi:hypothetical protein
MANGHVRERVVSTGYERLCHLQPSNLHRILAIAARSEVASHFKDSLPAPAFSIIGRKLNVSCRLTECGFALQIPYLG